MIGTSRARMLKRTTFNILQGFDMRVSGNAQLKLEDGSEFIIELSAIDFTFVETWEPSLVIVDIYVATIEVDGEEIELTLDHSHGAFGQSLSVYVGSDSPSRAEVIKTSKLKRLEDNTPPNESNIAPTEGKTREEHIAEYHATLEAIALEAREAAHTASAQLEPIILAAVDRMEALPAPYNERYSSKARALFFASGYYETETLSLPEGASIAQLVAALLPFADEHRGVDVSVEEGRRENHRAVPHELNHADASIVLSADARVQFSTAGPGGLRPGIAYKREEGGFVFDGPRDARADYKKAILSAFAANP